LLPPARKHVAQPLLYRAFPISDDRQLQFSAGFLQRTRKSPNRNIVTTANTRFYLTRIPGGFPATLLAACSNGFRKIAATQPNAAETV
jgi:hypothetical protein